jgi:hypothetical protein
MAATAAIFNDTSTSRHFGCSLVMRELRRRLAEANIAPRTMHYVGSDWRPQFFDPEADAPFGRGTANLVIVNGEGSIHHSSSRDRARYLSEISFLARDYFKAPGVLVNTTVHDIDDECARSLQAYSSIFVRERRSQRELAAFGVLSEIAPDLSIAAPSFSAPAKRSGICGTDSVLPDVTKALRSLCATKSWTFLPMKRRGRDLCGAIFNRDPLRYARQLAAHNLVVTGRFHGVCFCLATRTPFVAIDSNTPKISSLVEDVFGSTRRISAPDALDGLNTARLSRWEPQEVAALEHYLAFARQRTDALFQYIRRVAL